LYTVKEGDTLSTIAAKFSITTNTILWANDLTRSSKIKVGQKLTILPVTGIQYVVKKGDTISTIAKKFDGDMEEILSYNDLEDAGKIKVGMELIIPNGEIHVEKKVASTPAKTTPVTTVKTKDVETLPAKSEVVTISASVDMDDVINNGAVPAVTVRGVNTNDYFTHPAPGSVQTQGKHGYNSVDFGAKTGTPVVAAADGVVIVEKGAGKWYGGYGNHIVIEHDNGTQTLYAHNSKNLVNVGDIVKQGQTIGLVGSTGRSTGSHLHFEVRGGINPWVGKPKGTQY
jgi:murein DD-endopeptidase MepM/ murein hydrolase activator NlpD